MNYGIEALLSGQDIILQKRIRTTSSLYQVSQKTFMYVKVGLAFPWPGNGVNCAKSSWSRITAQTLLPSQSSLCLLGRRGLCRWLSVSLQKWLTLRRCGSAIAEDSRFEGPVTVNWQFESGSPLLPSYEQMPPPLSAIEPFSFRSVHRAGCILTSGPFAVQICCV